MTENREKIILEAVLVHRAEGDTSSCQRKVKWWPFEAKPKEKRGILINIDSHRYAVRCLSSRKDVCTHKLPEPGMAIILRHRPKGAWKSLYIAKIPEPTAQITKENNPTLLLSFDENCDFLAWEQKLRENLKVYSCDVEISQPAHFKGQATMHITAKYICLTKQMQMADYKMIYCKSSTKNRVQCFADANGLAHRVVVKSRNGACQDEFVFRTQHVDVIRKSLLSFENLTKIRPTKVNREPVACSSNTDSDCQYANVVKPTPLIADATESVWPSRYCSSQLKDKRFDCSSANKSSNKTIAKEDRIYAPCLYRYVNGQWHKERGSFSAKENTSYVPIELLNDKIARENRELLHKRSVSNASTHTEDEARRNSTQSLRTGRSFDSPELTKASSYVRVTEPLFDSEQLQQSSSTMGYENVDVKKQNEAAMQLNEAAAQLNEAGERAGDISSKGAIPSASCVSLEEDETSCKCSSRIACQAQNCGKIQEEMKQAAEYRLPLSNQQMHGTLTISASRHTTGSQAVSRNKPTNSPQTVSNDEPTNSFPTISSTVVPSRRYINVPESPFLSKGERNNCLDKDSILTDESPPEIVSRGASWKPVTDHFENVTLVNKKEPSYCPTDNMPCRLRRNSSGTSQSSNGSFSQMSSLRSSPAPSQASNDCTLKAAAIDISRMSPTRRMAGWENWIPAKINSSEQLLPPSIPSRSYSPSAEKTAHGYENFNDESRRGSQESVELFVAMFAGEIVCGGAWTVGVIIVQREDTDTFKILSKLEGEFGRRQMTNATRSMDANSDIEICVKGCSQGFEVISQNSHVLRFSDLKKLGPSKWIVTEFQFLHNNENAHMFKCDLCIAPTLQNRFIENSAFTSQQISIVKNFSRSESAGCFCQKPSPKHSTLGISALDRRNLCQDLDLPAPLKNNWKALAAAIGVDVREIRIIENSKCDSYTEEVLQILESSFPEKCSIEYLRTIFEGMKRLDVLEYLS